LSLTLDLQKRKAAFKLCLEKAGINPTIANVQFAVTLDVSGSFRREHENGDTTNLVTRLVPWGLVFDPNGQIDMFTFADGNTAYHVGTADENNCGTYVRDHIIGKVPGWNGGTHYAPVLRLVAEQFGWGVEKPKARKPGLIGRIFGAKETQAEAPQQDRVLNVLVTDGENDDQRQTMEFLRMAQKQQYGAYYLFIAISRDGHDFPFLQKIADDFGNTHLVIVDDLPEFVCKSDDDLNGILLGEELIRWLKQ